MCKAKNKCEMIECFRCVTLTYIETEIILTCCMYFKANIHVQSSTCKLADRHFFPLTVTVVFKFKFMSIRLVINLELYVRLHLLTCFKSNHSDDMCTSFYLWCMNRYWLLLTSIPWRSCNGLPSHLGGGGGGEGYN